MGQSGSDSYRIGKNLKLPTPLQKPAGLKSLKCWAQQPSLPKRLPLCLRCALVHQYQLMDHLWTDHRRPASSKWCWYRIFRTSGCFLTQPWIWPQEWPYLRYSHVLSLTKSFDRLELIKTDKQRWILQDGRQIGVMDWPHNGRIEITTQVHRTCTDRQDERLLPPPKVFMGCRHNNYSTPSSGETPNSLINCSVLNYSWTFKLEQNITICDAGTSDTKSGIWSSAFICKASMFNCCC